jgi:hypothetical protein
MKPEALWGLAGAFITFCVFWYILWPFAIAWAWNTFAAGLYHQPSIGYWQAAAISILTGLVRHIDWKVDKK